MKFRLDELEFLSAWAREEKAPDPYELPAHRLQASHHVPSVTLIRAIKSWAGTVGKRDEEIFTLCANPSPSWPWATAAVMQARFEEILSAHRPIEK